MSGYVSSSAAIRSCCATVSGVERCLSQHKHAMQQIVSGPTAVGQQRGDRFRAAQQCGHGIVQFMCDAGDELTEDRHLFLMDQAVPCALQFIERLLELIPLDLHLARQALPPRYGD